MRSLTYVARRWATPEGRRNTRRWAWSVAIVVVYAVGGRVLWGRGLLPSTVDDLLAPYNSIRLTGAPDETLIPVAIAVGLLLGLPAVVQAARATHTLRPWQPHSGGGYLATAREPIPIPTATWQAFAQQVMLDRAATPPPAPAETTLYLVPSAVPAPPTAVVAAQPDQPQEAAAAAPELSQLAAAEALLGSHDAGTDPPGGVRVFHLFGKHEKMHQPRYTALAYISYHGGSARTEEACKAFGQASDSTRSLFLRCVKAGWLRSNGRGSWAFADGVVTDLDALHAAVINIDEGAADALAAGIGPPLPQAYGRTADWVDNPLYGPGRMTPREDLRAAADRALASAAERWPANRVFTIAADNLYDD